MQFFKDRIKAKDLDGKKGEVLEGWLKRISDEDPDAEVGPVLGFCPNPTSKRRKIIDSKVTFGWGGYVGSQEGAMTWGIDLGCFFFSNLDLETWRLDACFHEEMDDLLQNLPLFYQSDWGIDWEKFLTQS